MNKVKIARFLRSVSVGLMGLAVMVTIVFLAGEPPLNNPFQSYAVNLKYAAIPALIVVVLFFFRRLPAIWAGLDFDDGDPEEGEY